MINKFINKLRKNFATSSQDEIPGSTPVEESTEAVSTDVLDSAIDLQGFVDQVVGHLVDEGTEYSVDSEEDNGKITVKIHCPTGQVGRIIGKNGKTIEAIRLLLRDAASRNQLKAKVVVVEAS